MYIAECPEVGTVDQGETIEQAVAGLKRSHKIIFRRVSLVTNNIDEIAKQRTGYFRK